MTAAFRRRAVGDIHHTEQSLIQDEDDTGMLDGRVALDRIVAEACEGYDRRSRALGAVLREGLEAFAVLGRDLGHHFGGSDRSLATSPVPADFGETRAQAAPLLTCCHGNRLIAATPGSTPQVAATVWGVTGIPEDPGRRDLGMCR